MRTDLAIAIDALSNLGGMPHVNNVELAGYIDDFCMYDPSMGAPKGDCICILGEHDSDDWRILQSPGNYVVVDKPDASALGHLRPGSNAVILPPGTSVEHIIRRVRSAVGAARTIHRHAPALLEVSLEGASLDSLMDLAATMLDNPCCLLVMDGSAIAASKPVQTDDDLWDRLVYQRVRTTEDADLVQILDYAQSLFYENITRPAFFEVSPWKRRLMSGVWIGGSCSHLFVVLENEHPIRLEDRFVTECICDVLSHMLERETPAAESPTAIFEALLRGEQVDPAHALEVMRESGFVDASPARLAILHEEGRPPSFMRTMRLLDDVRKALPKANAFVHEDKVVASVAQPDSEARASVEAFFRKAGTPALVMGVSHPISSFEEVRRAYRQCEAALELGSGTIRRYEEVISTDLIRQLPASLAPEEYCPKVAYDIVDYDRANGTEYAWTILRWLRHFKDPRRVAEELHIHVNTVRYRLERASQLFGIDMDDDALVDCLRTSFEVMMAAGTRLPRA